MKKIINHTVCFLLVFSTLLTADAQNKTLNKTPVQMADNKAPVKHPPVFDDSLPKTIINVNVLGLLQFGAIVQGEFRVSKQGYFTPHIRLPYLGVLYHVINADDRSNKVTVSPLALGIGAGYKSLLPTTGGAWYLGGVAEYSFGSSKGSDGADWKSKFSNVAVMANAGYRWRWPKSGKVLSIGAYAGAYGALRDEWWYKTSPGKTNDERSTTALAMLELSFGWER